MRKISVSTSTLKRTKLTHKSHSTLNEQEAMQKMNETIKEFWSTVKHFVHFVKHTTLRIE